MKQTPSHQYSQRPLHRQGFTLIELLVTMAIIATLSGITFSWAAKRNYEAKVSAKKLKYKQLFMANETYAAENGGICPAKNGSNLWLLLLRPYLSANGNGDAMLRDDLWKDYNPDLSYVSGIGMAFKHKLPESNARNVFWDEDDEDGARMSFEEITHTSTRIFMGDSISWFLKDNTVDATRHEDPSDPDVTRGMFLLFDGSVTFYTEDEAKLGLTNPASLVE